MAAEQQVPAPLHAEQPGSGDAAGGTLGRFVGDKWIILGVHDWRRHGDGLDCHAGSRRHARAEVPEHRWSDGPAVSSHAAQRKQRLVAAAEKPWITSSGSPLPRSAYSTAPNLVITPRLAALVTIGPTGSRPAGSALTPRPAYEEVAEMTLKPGVRCARGVGCRRRGFSVVADVVACGFAGRGGGRINLVSEACRLRLVVLEGAPA